MGFAGLCEQGGTVTVKKGGHAVARKAAFVGTDVQAEKRAKNIKNHEKPRKTGLGRVVGPSDLDGATPGARLRENPSGLVSPYTRPTFHTTKPLLKAALCAEHRGPFGAFSWTL